MEDAEKIRARVAELAMPLVDARGLVFWGLEVIPGGTLTVRLYVDNGDDGAGLAGIDQCEAISRQLGLALDVEDVIDQPWTLEVSSPGFDRKFFRLEQMRPFVGDVVDCRLFEPLGDTGRKRWRGKLLSVGADSFELAPCAVSAEGEICCEAVAPARLRWQDIAHAQRVHIFAAPRRPGKKSAQKRAK